MRLPFCCWSTSTLSEMRVAFTTTSLVFPGRTEIAPYCVSTEIFALGPTVKRYSFLLSAKAAVARHVANTRVTTVVGRNAGSRFVPRRLTIKLSPCGRDYRSALPLLNTIQRNLVKKSFLLISIHQMLPGVHISRI